MGAREFPFDENEVCDNCGRQGAFDLYGDFVCGVCLSASESSWENEGGQTFAEPGVGDLT